MSLKHDNGLVKPDFDQPDKPLIKLMKKGEHDIFWYESIINIVAMQLSSAEQIELIEDYGYEWDHEEGD